MNFPQQNREHEEPLRRRLIAALKLKCWFTTSFLQGGRCRKTMLREWVALSTTTDANR